jgi:hypothetical protein
MRELVLILLALSVCLSESFAVEIEDHTEDCKRMAKLLEQIADEEDKSDRYWKSIQGKYAERCEYGEKTGIPMFERHINLLTVAQGSNSCFNIEDDLGDKVLAARKMLLKEFRDEVQADCEKAPQPGCGVLVGAQIPDICVSGQETAKLCKCLSLRNTCSYPVTAFYRISDGGKTEKSQIDIAKNEINRLACTRKKEQSIEFLGWERRAH